MKKVFFLIAIMIFSVSNAQWRINNDKEDKFTTQDNKKLTWGYFLGLNSFDSKLHPSDTGINDYGRLTVRSEAQMGFTAGLMGRLKLNEHFGLVLQPGIHFSERTLSFEHIRENQSYETPAGTFYVATAEDSIRSIKSSYIDIPLFIQLQGNRWFNTRPYIQAGVGYAVNLQSNEGSEDDNEDGVFRMKTHGFNYQIEAGISIYFRRFKLTPSVKGMFFLNNELGADDASTAQIWAGSLKSLHTRAIVFSLKFE